MEDMEMEVESTESGASTGSSPEASESSSNNGAVETASQTKPDTTPFHEHPRFKELVEQKNETLKRYQDMESRYKTLEQQLNSFKESQPKPASETEKALEELKQVHPGLAAAVKQALDGSSTAKQLQERLDAFERQAQESARQQTIAVAVGKINSLHESNKMSDFGKQFINNQLDLAYRAGKLNASDLKAVESAYSEAAKAIKAYEDSLKRDVTKSYVEAKSKDAAVPASVPKGVQAKPAPKSTPAFKSKDDMKAAIVKEYAKQRAAESSSNNV